MIFIDYPPGGLGHFLAQILTTDDELPDNHISFHRNLKKKYSALTLESSEQFCQQIKSFVPSNEVTVTHSFGNINELRTRWPSATIIQVVARQEIAILLNNMWRKAAAANPNSETTLSNRLIQHYKKDTVAIRREDYALSYLYFKQNAGYHNTRHPMTDIEINFDNLYQGPYFMHTELLKIKKEVDITKIDKVFQTTQQPIIQKNNLYKELVAESISWEQHKHYFDTIDHGLICGMLQEKHNREFFLPNQDHFELSI
jgi:hypothetical protein